jgi:hypothetical protein
MSTNLKRVGHFVSNSERHDPVAEDQSKSSNPEIQKHFIWVEGKLHEMEK